ncbi:hypothetical protein G8759_10715 [Spirosoma aureum]|uniref:Uncharacterized protein n=1 Tax=Spirosoma aureum TaxID=2692134 RepID=A0A6G9AL61_9BACT|nr:hypothetical protein [Spirosoma aureum]QIP13066.1 hypothetical protein G8759_10715 [Spirosoma aureum]
MGAFADIGQAMERADKMSISVNELTAIFEVFVQGNTSRVRPTVRTGSGLG